MKQKRLSETLPVRLPVEVDRRLKLVSKATGLNKSDTMRLAIAHGLPLLEMGRIALSAKDAA